VTDGFDVVRSGPEDLESLVPLFEAYREWYGRLPDEATARGFLRERLVRGDSVIFLARDAASGEALGFTQLYPSFSSLRMNREWILNDLYVTREARGRGVGRRMMERARDLAIETEAVAVVLATQKENVVAKALYDSLGYRLDDEFDYYELAL
jgi:ribosomal protein S18 acetylase RimI-like enzyme